MAVVVIRSPYILRAPRLTPADEGCAGADDAVSAPEGVVDVTEFVVLAVANKVSKLSLWPDAPDASRVDESRPNTPVDESPENKDCSACVLN